MYPRSQSCGWGWDLNSDVSAPLHTPSLITSIQDSELRGSEGGAAWSRNASSAHQLVPETCLETKQITVA